MAISSTDNLPASIILIISRIAALEEVMTKEKGEYPKGIYTEHGDAVFSGEAELQQFADAHGTATIINDDTRLKGE